MTSLFLAASISARTGLIAQASPDVSSVIRARVSAALTPEHIPGAVVAVSKDGSVASLQAFGVRDKRGTPMTESTRFAIGSLTKQFTAVAVLMLAQDGKLSLDDALAKYFPRLPNANGITLRMLLNQTSGLHNYPNTTEHAWPLHGAIDPAALFAIFATDQPDFAPGTKWEYSNTNYAVLAGIVAKVSGIHYGAFLQQHIFTPLQMTSSGYGYAAQANIAEATWQGQWYPANQQLSLDLYYGAGGIVSTAADLVKWDDALMTGALLDAASMRDLWTSGTLNNGSPTAYAMGFVPSSVDGQEEVWHNGLAPSVGGLCYNALFPKLHLAVIVLTNAGDESLDTFSSDLVRAALEAYVPVAAASGEDPAITALVRSLLVQFRSGTLDRDDFEGTFNAAITPQLVRANQPFFEHLGDVTTLTFTGSEPVRHSTLYSYRGAFSDGSVHDIQLCVYQGKVCGFRVIP